MSRITASIRLHGASKHDTRAAIAGADQKSVGMGRASTFWRKLLCCSERRTDLYRPAGAGGGGSRTAARAAAAAPEK